MSTVYHYIAALYAARQVPQYLKQCQAIVAKVAPTRSSPVRRSHRRR